VTYAMWVYPWFLKDERIHLLWTIVASYPLFSPLHSSN
jgi:hypothetical protein